MSMAMALQGVRDYLRQQCGWTVKQCGVQEEGIPPLIAGEFYVAIDESSIIGTDSRNYFSGEDFEISTYVWRRVGRWPADYRGKMLMPEDVYLASIETLEDLERKIYVTINKKFGLQNFINSLFGLPDLVKGDKFILPLNFQGRGGSRSIGLPGAGEQDVFYGREIRYRGLKRNQHIGSDG